MVLTLLKMLKLAPSGRDGHFPRGNFNRQAAGNAKQILFAVADVTN